MIYNIELRDGDACQQENSGPTERWYVESDLTAGEIQSQLEELMGDRYWDGDYDVSVSAVGFSSLDSAKAEIEEMIAELGEEEDD